MKNITQLILFIFILFTLIQQVNTTGGSLQITNHLPVHNNYPIWSKPIQKATNVVIHFLNHNTSSLNTYSLNRIHIEESSVLGGTFYSLQAELDNGHVLQNRFIDHTYLKFDWLGLASNNQTSPQFHPIQLCGPLETYLTAPFSLDLFLPHNVDAGTNIRQINIHKGVCVVMSSIRSIELIDPLPISEVEKIKFVPKYHVRLDRVPRLRISADSPIMVSKKKLKVKRFAPSKIELLDPEEGLVPNGFLNSSLEIDVGEKLMNVILPQHTKNLIGDGTNKLPSVRRLMTGNAEAVNLYKLALNVKKEEKEEMEWEALVMEGEREKFQVISLERRGARVAAAYDIGLALNGSLPLHMFSLKNHISNLPPDYVVN